MRRSDIQTPLMASIGIHLTLAVVLVATESLSPSSLADSAGMGQRRAPLVFETERSTPPAPKKRDSIPTKVTTGANEASPESGQSGPQSGAQSSPSLQNQWSAFAARLEAAVRSEVRYPLALRRARREGEVLLKIRLMPEGALSGAILKGSGDQALDRIAANALDRALKRGDLNPEAKETAARTGREISFTLPVRFNSR